MENIRRIMESQLVLQENIHEKDMRENYGKAAFKDLEIDVFETEDKLNDTLDYVAKGNKRNILARLETSITSKALNIYHQAARDVNIYVDI